MSDSNCTPKAYFNKDNVNILLYEENAAIRTVCEKMLADYTKGTKTFYTIVGEGEAARDIALSGGCGICIFDPNAQSFDGYELAREIMEYAQQDNKKIFIYAHSNAITELQWIRCKDAGFCGVLYKPLDVVALNKFIEKIQAKEI